MKRLSAIAAVLLLAVPASAQALDTIVDPTTNSPCTRGAFCKTIAEAVGVSQTGDSVTVKPGTYVEDVTADVTDLLLRADGAAALNGTLTVPSAGVTVEGLTIFTTSGDGPAVSATGANLELIDTAVAAVTGTAVRVTAGNANLIRRSQIAGAVDGIQFPVTGAGERRLAIDSSIVLGGLQGAAYRVSTADLSGDAVLDLRHVTTAGGGGGLVLDGSGGGLLTPGDITATVTGSILHGDSTAAGFTGAPPLVAANQVKATYTDSDASTPALSGGATQSGGDATLIPDADLFGDARLRLKRGSPAIGNGGPLVDGESDRDLDGDARVADGASDMGADEYVNHAPVVKLTLDKAELDSSDPLVATTIASDPEGASDIASISVDWGDGTTSSGARAEHTYGKTGTYTVTATATDQAGATSAPATAEVVVRDTAGPQVLVTNPKEGASVALSGKKRQFAVKGVHADASGVSEVEIALTRRTGGCVHFDGRALKRQGCKRPIFVPAVLKGMRFRLKTPLLKFKPGNYQVRVRATDTLGNTTQGFTKAARTLVTFKVT